MRVIGIIIVLWGFVDFGMSYAGTDVYGDWLGVNVGELYPYTHWIAFAVGGVISWIGGSQDENV